MGKLAAGRLESEPGMVAILFRKPNAKAKHIKPSTTHKGEVFPDGNACSLIKKAVYSGELDTAGWSATDRASCFWPSLGQNGRIDKDIDGGIDVGLLFPLHADGKG